jgi:hypothetical protein
MNHITPEKISSLQRKLYGKAKAKPAYRFHRLYDKIYRPEKRRATESVIGYLEAHIEQGPVLESENRPVAVVTAISGASRGEARIIGESAHAGATPMPCGATLWLPPRS